MIEKLLIICVFVGIIHMIETLAYSVRLAGLKTRKLVVALSLFNIIVIVSRTANMVQAPLTGKLGDAVQSKEDLPVLLHQLQTILIAASIGTIAGALLIPSFVSIFSRMISHLEVAGSVPKMMKNIASIHTLEKAKKHVKRPRWIMLSQLRIGGVPKRLLLLNLMATTIYTVGVLSTLYASTLEPTLSKSILMSSGLINGLAMITLAVFVDPQVAILTEKVMKGESTKQSMNKMVGTLVISRLCGTVCAQILLVPAALYIAWICKLIP
ncbi:lipid II flippase Amj family protein [Priestia megaterium]|uniref:lipid II flippase Amj family protein n=1 Tax=Priestia megaterium TaxID=1404 RepID=UPI0029FC8E7C|nr:lipid II flippase Amj family protein [Bacillus sp. ET1]MED3813619.1 lipid II flippase Amj family protein [Priestia megaterium]MED4182216.1 lipid II flippase Amj family protein [Priestia megaterium]